MQSRWAIFIRKDYLRKRREQRSHCPRGCCSSLQSRGRLNCQFFGIMSDAFAQQDHLQDITLFSLSDKKARILDMAQPTRSYPDTAHRIICTTKEVIWLDLDKPGAPVMRHQHYRDDDKTLSLHSEFCDGVYHTFLWSRKTPVMTVYTTPAIGPLQLVLPPYILPPPIPNLRRSGINSIHIPSKQLKRSDQILPESLILVESAADGAVYQRELIIESIPTMARGYEHGRLEHKRLNADQPLLHLPLRDPKVFKLAHLFMLYNSMLFRQSSAMFLSLTLHASSRILFKSAKSPQRY